MKNFALLLPVLLFISCSTLQTSEKKASNKLSTFENRHIKFNYSKDWQVCLNDSITDKIILAPISNIKTNDYTGISGLFSKLTITSNDNISPETFRKKYSLKKNTSKISNEKINQTSYIKIKQISEFHFVEKTRVNITTKTARIRNLNSFYTAHHFFHNNSEYVLLFQNDDKKTSKNKKQAKIIFESFEIK